MDENQTDLQELIDVAVSLAKKADKATSSGYAENFAAASRHILEGVAALRR